jgi:hypothetical protein
MLDIAFMAVPRRGNLEVDNLLVRMSLIAARVAAGSPPRCALAVLD